MTSGQSLLTVDLHTIKGLQLCGFGPGTLESTAVPFEN